MEDEIKQLQTERAQIEGRITAFTGVGDYDNELYGAASGEFDTSIAVEEDVVEEEAHESVNSQLASKKAFLNSFTAPKQFFDETRIKDDFDPMKELKRKTIGEKEDEYHARWRKRKLSPPRNDAFAPQADKSMTSYKEQMQDVLLEKERADVIRKIQQKQREEEQQQTEERRKKEREEHKKEKKAKKAKKEGRDVSDSSPSTPKADKLAKEPGSSWRFEIFKGGQSMGTVKLEPDTTYNCGRSEEADIKLEHLSCSKNHAKISFIGGSPQLMDLNSTNSTLVNGKEITPGQWHKLAEKDIVKFGCSTREYHVRS